MSKITGPKINCPHCGAVYSKGEEQIILDTFTFKEFPVTENCVECLLPFELDIKVEISYTTVGLTSTTELEA